MKATARDPTIGPLLIEHEFENVRDGGRRGGDNQEMFGGRL
ncbi:hypothetical protein OCAR_7487 [Afipia carboxidovorans OM5]|nr:hypothetical protein OCAR_7487 [Afipia carboxidovorans OM5]